MGLYEQLIHVLNFMAPAWGLALFCAICARGLTRLGLPRAAWRVRTQVWVNGVLGVAVLLAGLVLWGVDGKMATWGALVFASGTCQWLMCQAWRR
jgi:hypothetical protein